ncbi:MAG: hypothetical protein QQN41_04105 [Nitrosopumilus sp.]
MVTQTEKTWQIDIDIDKQRIIGMMPKGKFTVLAARKTGSFRHYIRSKIVETTDPAEIKTAMTNKGNIIEIAYRKNDKITATKFEIKTAKATKEYECACGETVKQGTKLHICQNCDCKQCPNCFDYNNQLCEECISG